MNFITGASLKPDAGVAQAPQQQHPCPPSSRPSSRKPPGSSLPATTSGAGGSGKTGTVPQLVPHSTVKQKVSSSLPLNVNLLPIGPPLSATTGSSSTSSSSERSGVPTSSLAPSASAATLKAFSEGTGMIKDFFSGLQKRVVEVFNEDDDFYLPPSIPQHVQHLRRVEGTARGSGSGGGSYVAAGGSGTGGAVAIGGGITVGGGAGVARGGNDARLQGKPRRQSMTATSTGGEGRTARWKHEFNHSSCRSTFARKIPVTGYRSPSTGHRVSVYTEYRSPRKPNQ